MYAFNWTKCWTSFQRTFPKKNSQAFHCANEHLFCRILRWNSSYECIYGSNPHSISIANGCKHRYSKCKSTKLSPILNDRFHVRFLLQVVVSVIGLAGTIAGVFFLKLMGKRNLFLVALLGITASLFVLCSFDFNFFLIFFFTLTETFHHFSCLWFCLSTIGNKIIWYHNHHTSIRRIIRSINFILFDAILHNNYTNGELNEYFSWIFKLNISFAIFKVPYAMLSELFSMKSRSMATAIATGVNNILAFVAIKSFYNLEHWFDLPSTMGVYGTIGLFG